MGVHKAGDRVADVRTGDPVQPGDRLMLKVIPLGGLGEIGLNSMVIEHGDEALLIDAGLMFPTASMPGVDIILPDFAWLAASAA